MTTDYERGLLTDSYTFSAKRADWSEPKTSAGRWDELTDCASAAARFIENRAAENEQWSIEIHMVTEIDIDDNGYLREG